MKMSAKILCAAALVAGLATASADQTTTNKSGTTPAKKKADKTANSNGYSVKIRPQTGSYIPRKVHLDGTITDGPYQLVVITEDAIRNSGANNLSQVLSRYGLRP